MEDASHLELERQERCLAQLPSDHQFALFYTRQALDAQRDSDYRTVEAARELIDNAVDAGARRAHVAFDGAGEMVDDVAFIDDGPGMLPEMVRYALSWGGGTSLEAPGLIGRYGLGLPAASISQTTRVEVYSRTERDASWHLTVLDIDAYEDLGIQVIPEAVAGVDLPGFVRAYRERHSFDGDHGTVILWRGADRLSSRVPARLRDDIVEDLAPVYRHLLNVEGSDVGIELAVEGRRVEPVDPLFLMPAGRGYLPPEEGGAQLTLDLRIPVVLWRDPELGDRRLLRMVHGPPDQDRDWVVEAESGVEVRVSRLQPGFAVEDGPDESRPTVERDRFEVRRRQLGVSFVRGGREVGVTAALPGIGMGGGPRNAAAGGLGRWPEVDGPATFWACEVRFQPEVDIAFGLSSKKEIDPSAAVWRLLAEEDVDAHLRGESEWHRRHQLLAPPLVERGATLAELAADAALDQQEPSTRRRCKVEYFESSSAPFYEPRQRGEQIVVRINRAHPYYEHVYAPMRGPDGPDTVRQAFDVLLIALAKAELEADGSFYRDQRERLWSPFLGAAAPWLEFEMRKLGVKGELDEPGAAE